MKQEQFDKVVDMATRMYGNELNSRAEFDSALAALVRMDEDDAEYTSEEIDALIKKLRPDYSED